MVAALHGLAHCRQRPMHVAAPALLGCIHRVPRTFGRPTAGVASGFQRAPVEPAYCVLRYLPAQHPAARPDNILPRRCHRRPPDNTAKRGEKVSDQALANAIHPLLVCLPKLSDVTAGR